MCGWFGPGSLRCGIVSTCDGFGVGHYGGGDNEHLCHELSER